ncbi:MAG: ImmA/IrrE family metallo-endopeptidase [Phycisphaerales bacterium]|jgi:Zn-dependent peptidase ImmA (M78 family)|nr:ImmA/IrrE family metallo-endopeptidase [Phycisphaerales bacterium]
MTRVAVKPELLDWARERAGLAVGMLADRFPKLDAWRQGEIQPTLKQLEEYARATRTPIGLLFLPKPPVENVPIPDLRTIGSERLGRPSPDLLDTIHLCQQRQDWYRQNALVLGEERLQFVGSATVQSDVVDTAARMRQTVGFDLDARAEAATFLNALRNMIDAADRAGILVMVSGIVGQNTHRPLDTAEFRGFALSDDLAPLIFINGADTKSGQMFTLAHELAHLWLGQSGVSDVTPASSVPQRALIERWCNAVAAEMLVPLDGFRQAYNRRAELRPEVQRLSRVYKVSTLVVLRRMLDAGGLTRPAFQAAFDDETKRLRAEMASKKAKSTGGDPFATGRVRVSPRFGRALIAATWEGRATFTEASRLLGFKSVKTIDRFGEELGLAEYVREGAV